MDQPLIVLVDTDARKVFLYGEYNREFLLEELYILKAFLKGKNVMYVTQATELSGEEMVEAIADISEQLDPVEVPKRFFRIKSADKSKEKEYTFVSDINTRFSGSKDCKPIEQFGSNIFERSPKMLQLLLSGQLEVLSEEDVEQLKKKPKPKNPKESEDILIQGKKEDILYGDGMFGGEGDIDDNEDIETDEDIALKKGYGQKKE